MADKSIPALTDKQHKDLMVSATAFRPPAGLELVGSKRGFWATGIDIKTHTPYGEWSLETRPGGATVKAILGDRQWEWRGTLEDLHLGWSYLMRGLMRWQKAINAIELDARAKEDPTLRHLTPTTLSDPSHYNILGGPQW